MLQKTELIECSSACRKSTGRRPPARSGRRSSRPACRTRCSSRGRRSASRSCSWPRVERGRAVTTLKVEPGRVEAVGRAVQERRRRRAGGADVVDPAEVASRSGSGRRSAARPSRAPRRCAGRARRPRRTCPRAAASRRAAAPGRTVSQTSLPLIVAPLSWSSVVFEDGVQVRVRARQVVVQRRLEPGARARLRRVADEVREEAALRVAAEVERLAADLLRPVRARIVPSAARISPRLIVNCATRWISLSCRSARPALAQVCQ